MAQAANQQIPGPSLSRTADLAKWVHGLHHDDLSQRTKTRIEHAMLDWFGVALAGVSEPLTQKLIACYGGQGDTARIIGSSARTSTEYAALINGSGSHALDYDDVCVPMYGHPSVAILPAVLALAEERNASMKDAALAFAAGVEIAAQLGMLLGKEHYQRGFHATATHGSVAAAAACARLLKLDEAQTLAAFGIGATQAAGLKSNFGTMTKPFHAGRAAMNGVMAARMAESGFTAKEDILDCDQGYLDVLSDIRKPPALALPEPGDALQIENNLFKFHAACALTHSAISAAADLRENAASTWDDIVEIRLYGDPILAKTCGIADPKTGLDVKFSIQHVLVAGLLGHDTASPDYYTDQIASDPDVVALRNKVTLHSPREKNSPISQVDLRLHLRDGRIVGTTFDTNVPIRSDKQQQARLEEKFTALVGARVGADTAAEMRGLFPGSADSDRTIAEFVAAF